MAANSSIVTNLIKGLQPIAMDAIQLHLSAEEDLLREFGGRVATHMAQAIATGADTLEFKAQLKLIAEDTRITTESASWDLAEKVLTTVFTAARAGLLAGMGV